MRKAVPAAAVSLILVLGTPCTAAADTLRSAIAAYDHADYTAAAAMLLPLAQRGNASAQAYIGSMYASGRGVPQNYVAAAYWLRRGAEQGDGRAQYLLGLMYDKGQGVAQDYIQAHKWLNLATAHAPPAVRDYSARLRDAVATKMTRGQLGTARLLALQWVPVIERLPADIRH